MIIFYLLPLIVTTIFVYLFGFALFNDLGVRTKSKFKFNKLLLVFPHPDDEVFTAGGLVRKLTKPEREVNVLILTRGEKGTPDAHRENGLKEVRTTEANRVADILGVKRLILKDFPDGGLDKRKNKIKKEIELQIKNLDPELIITFDKTGLYGHPDHITTSEVITDLVKQKFKDKKLWYASSSKKVLQIMNLPEHMAKNRQFKKKRKYPNIKIFIGMSGLSAKIKGVYSYKSQFESFSKAYPVNWIPLWIYFLVQPFEYFYEVN